MDTVKATIQPCEDVVVSKSPSRKFIVRKACRDDLDDVLDMIQELAEFEKLSDGPKLTVEELIRDGGFNSDTAHPLFVCFVAEETCNPSRNNEPAALLGYAMTFVGYSTWTGKVLQLKDLFVRAEARRSGVGRALFRAVGEHANRGQFARLDYYVFDWNERAIAFYKAMGAEDVSVTGEWSMYRMPLRPLN